jgi:hypothetical protein
VTQLPDFLHQPFSDAMSQSMLLPAFVALFGVVAALFLIGAIIDARPASALAFRVEGADRGRVHRVHRVHRVDGSEWPTDEIPAIGERYLPDEYRGMDEYRAVDEYGALDTYRALDKYFSFVDELDDYAEYTLEPPPPIEDDFQRWPTLIEPDFAPPSPPPDETDTQPIAARPDPLRGEPVDLDPDSGHGRLYHEPPDRWLRPSAEQIGFAHNGRHVDREALLRDVSSDEQPSRGRHAADRTRDDDPLDPDADSYGRHSRF